MTTDAAVDNDVPVVRAAEVARAGEAAAKRARTGTEVAAGAGARKGS